MVDDSSIPSTPSHPSGRDHGPANLFTSATSVLPTSIHNTPYHAHPSKKFGSSSTNSSGSSGNGNNEKGKEGKGEKEEQSERVD